jgi:hypothetical protein
VTLKVIEQAHAFGLNMVKFPSHTSHTLQPLDMSYFKPFKRTFRKESNNAKIKNRYLKPNKIKLAIFVKTTLDKTLSPKNIKFGLRVIRI